MEGIVTGKVSGNWDTNHQGMVQVTYLLGTENEMKTNWVSVMTPFGGNGYGSYRLPEVGNTVVVGFEHGNPNRPVVLGCLWSHDNLLPEHAAKETNSKYLWKSKLGYTLFVEEEDQIVSFSDPEGKNSLVWSVKDKCLVLDVEEKLVLKVGGAEFLTMEKGKITAAEGLEIEAKKNLSAKALDDLMLEGTNIKLIPQQNTEIKGNKTEITSSQAVSIKTQQFAAEGTTMALKGKQTSVEGTTLELKAQVSGKIQSSGILELKGPLMKLN